MTENILNWLMGIDMDIIVKQVEWDKRWLVPVADIVFQTW